MERIIRLIQWGILEKVQLLLELTCLIAIAYDISSLKKFENVAMGVLFQYVVEVKNKYL